VEQQLAAHVERPAHQVIERLRQGTFANAKERGDLALYIATLFKRGPKHRKRAEAMLPAVLEECIQRLKDHIRLTTAGDDEESRAELANRLAEADELKQRFEKEPPPEVVDQIRTPWPSPAVLEAVYVMTWRFFKIDGPAYFLTSDNPAHFFEASGVGSPDSEFVFPISSKLALHGSFQPGPQGTVLLADRGLVHEVNRRIASGAVRFVFSPERAEWMKSVCLHHETNFKRIDWGWLRVIDRLKEDP
jgi:hypothetical protein